jgi:hypothetical protein
MGQAMGRQEDKKKRDREERKRLEKHKSSIRNIYPSFTFLNEHIVDKNLVKLVIEAAEKIDYEEIRRSIPAEFDGIREFLKNLQKFGFMTAYHMLSETLFPPNITEEDKRSNSGWIVRRANKLVTLLLINIGDNILKYRHDEIASFWPYQGFRLIYTHATIGIIFQRMIKTKSDDGSFLHQHIASQHIIHNKKKINISFTHHAMERIIDRFTDPSKTGTRHYYTRYVGLYEFFIYSKFRFVKSLKFLKSKGETEPYLQFYFPIELDYWSMKQNLEVNLQDLTNLSGENPYFDKGDSGRVLKPFQVYTTCVGCPCAIEWETGRAICITSLIPGYYPSPEHQAFKKNKVTSKKKQEELRHRFFGTLHMKSDGYLEALRFFHDNGFPQIFLEEPVNNKNSLYVPQLYAYQSEIPDFLPTFAKVEV